MKITLYFINYNDSFYFPFIKEHYGKFCQRIVCYDNYSTDNSHELALSLGFEVRKFGGSQLNDEDYLSVKNNVWKECRTPELHADYVIVCDADEFITIPSLPMTCSAPDVIGFNMISEFLPVKNIEAEINTGEYSEAYSKQAIFCPKRIEEISFVHGCHKNWKKGDVTNHDTCKLLHYRQIGGVNRQIARHAEYRKRMSAFNTRHKMGYHYLASDVDKINEWNALIANAKKLW